MGKWERAQTHTCCYCTTQAHRHVQRAYASGHNQLPLPVFIYQIKRIALALFYLCYRYRSNPMKTPKPTINPPPPPLTSICLTTPSPSSTIKIPLKNHIVMNMEYYPSQTRLALQIFKKKAVTELSQNAFIRVNNTCRSVQLYVSKCVFLKRFLKGRGRRSSQLLSNTDANRLVLLNKEIKCYCRRPSGHAVRVTLMNGSGFRDEK